MIDMTYDPDADAAYVYLGKGRIVESKEVGPFILDYDDQNRVIGIEILDASRKLAPGSWKHARLPGIRKPDAAE
ncbi:DUF2283 domain-containing protein [Notoacmeibacter marinus]|uniref:DUF2283 domain-containing protein n=1 Tax=Notoacmeibacter marinus TaxID=1876515 RepID=UPI001FE1A1BB|nr:DUF2283 domain-containing protein [Notoacmeibacter marinus]